MARVSKDSSSWKASGVIRRDARHTATATDDSSKKRSSSKDTHRWCKGKVGRSHILATRPWHHLTQNSYNRVHHWDAGYMETYCTVCGKVLRFFSRSVRWFSDRSSDDRGR